MRTTKATVKLSAVSQNLTCASRYAPDSKVLAVIKGNAYGHGAVDIARVLDSRVPAFAVGFMDEAVELRDASIRRPILILQGASTDSDVAEAAARDFWLMVHSRTQLDRILRSNTSSPVRVWLKVDTGMHRLGLDAAELDPVMADLAASDKVHHDSVLCTHLACSDELEKPVTTQQLTQFRALAQKYHMPLSIANSAGIMHWPESHAEWNRPGYMLYGNNPLPGSGIEGTDLVPAMTMTSDIIAINSLSAGDGVGYGLNWVAKRPSRIGIISIGYGDGYPRHARTGTPVLVKGQRVPLAGRVSMDMIAVDLTDLDEAEVGDSAELWGPGLSVNEVAQHAGTIGYEILAGLTGRVPISYVS